MEKSILVISYNIGTDKSVSGRRWGKFTTQLIKSGYNIFLLCNKYGVSSEFYNNSIKLTKLNSFYPKILRKYPNDIAQKFSYRLSLFFLKSITRGSYYDLGCLQKRRFQTKALKIIVDNNITNVIVSGVPFSYLYYVALLKKKIEFNFIADFRDAWTWSKINGISSLDYKRTNEENRREILVLKRADNIIVASIDLKSHLDLVLKRNKISKKVMVLTNSIESRNKEFNSYIFDNSKIIISHIGTIPLKTKKYWKIFLNYLDETDLDLNIDFYSNSNNEFYEEALKIKKNNINFLPRVSEKELQFKLQKSSFLLIFKQDDFSNTFSSKFFDYIKAQRPIIAFANSGIFSKELLDNKIGYVINEHTSFKSINKIITNKINIYNHNYEWKKFSTEYVTNKLEALIL